MDESRYVCFIRISVLCVMRYWDYRRSYRLLRGYYKDPDKHCFDGDSTYVTGSLENTLVRLLGIACAIPSWAVYIELNPQDPRRALQAAVFFFSMETAIIFFLRNKKKFLSIIDIAFLL